MDSGSVKNEKRYSSTSQSGDQEIICEYCHGKNHKERFCLKKQIDNRLDSMSHSVNSKNSKEDQFRKLAGKCPEIVININGVPVQCLVDSGSQVSTLTQSFF